MDGDTPGSLPPPEWPEENEEEYGDDGGEGAEEWDEGSARGPVSGRATASLVCGILGIVLSLAVCCCGALGIPPGLVGFVLGIVATVLGVGERKAIARGESSEAGSGQALAGMILGIIAMVLAVLAVAIMTVFVALSLSRQQGGMDFPDFD